MNAPATAAVRFLSGEREPVRVATTANVDLYGLESIDGVLLEVNDRVLVKDQSDARENGIYTVSTGRWYRASDANFPRAIGEGITVQSQEGDTNGGKAWRFRKTPLRIGTSEILIDFYLSANFAEDMEASLSGIVADIGGDFVMQAEVPVRNSRASASLSPVRDGISKLIILGEDGGEATTVPIGDPWFTSPAAEGAEIKTWYRAPKQGLVDVPALLSLNGIADLPDGMRFKLADGAAINGTNTAPLDDFPTQRNGWEVTGWTHSGASSVVYSDPNGYYNAQPCITHDFDGELLAFWQGSESGSSELEADTTVYQSKTVDGVWPGTRTRVLDNAALTNNATVFPSASVPGQTQVSHVTVGGVDQIWLLVNPSRFADSRGPYILKREAGGKFNIVRLMQDTATGGIVETTSGFMGATGPGTRSAWQVDGGEYAAIAQSIMQCRDGRIVVSLTLLGLTGAFTEASKRFAALVYEGGSWRLSGVAPVGNLAPTEAWESSVIETIDGNLEAFVRCNTGSNAGNKQARSTSTDGGLSWSATTYYGVDSHIERPDTAKVNGAYSVLALPDHSVNRNAQSLFLIGGGGLTPALCVSDETDASDYVHTSAISVDYERGRLLNIWGQGGVSPVHITSIRSAVVNSIPRADRLVVVPRKNAAYALDDPAHVATWDESTRQLSCAGQASAGLTLARGKMSYALRWRITVVPTVRAQAIIATIGSPSLYYAWRLQDHGGKNWLQLLRVSVNGSGQNPPESIETLWTEEVGDATKFQSLAFTFNTDTSEMQTAGRRYKLEGGYTSLILGDGYLGGSNPTTAQVIFDLDGVVARQIKTAPAVLASYNPSGDMNLFDNGDFALDQPNNGSGYGSTLGPKMDRITLSNLGGATVTTTRSVFSRTVASEFSNGIQTGLKHTNTAGAGSARYRQYYDNADHLAGVIGRFGATGYAAAGGPFWMELYWINQYGTGGSTERQTYLGRVYVTDTIPSRRNIRVAIPSIDISAVLGTGHRCALEWRIPTDVARDVTMSGFHLYPGDEERPFIPRSPQAELQAATWEYEVLSAVSGTTVFAMASAHSATSVNGVVSYLPKRAAPTVNSSGTFEFFSSAGNSSIANPTYPSAGTRSAEARFAATGLTVGMPGIIRAASDSDAKIIIAARHAT